MNIFSGFAPIVSLFKTLIIFLIVIAIFLIIAFFVLFFIHAKINLFKLFNAKKRNLFISGLCSVKIGYKIFDLMRWMLIDFFNKDHTKSLFPDFGFTFFVGRQGAGKTIGMVNYLKTMREKYPKCVIVSNFKCKYADHYMVDWRDILNVRNGEHGVIFAIDEIHSEYSAASWKDVPENLLSEISQQRKQRVKIIASAQYFCRIAKPLREQAFSVVSCSTGFKGRLTSCKMYDAEMYSLNIETGAKKIKPFQKYSFVQSDDLRNCYDTYEKINLMQKIKFIPRHER